MTQTQWLENHKWAAVALAFPLGLIVVTVCFAGLFGLLLVIAYVGPFFRPIAPAAHVVGIGLLWLIILAVVFGAGVWTLEKLGVRL